MTDTASGANTTGDRRAAIAEPTPGNWFIDPDEGEFVVSSDHGQIICTVLSAEDFPCLEEGTRAHMDEEARANALLIAAAKDLLAAVQRAVTRADETLALYPGRRRTPECQADYDACRAAIAKALPDRSAPQQPQEEH